MTCARSLQLALHVHKDIAGMVAQTAALLAQRCQEAGAARGVCRLAISGGSTPVALFRLLATQPWANTLPWDKMAFYWVDERCVPPDNAQSNFGVAHRELLAHVPAQYSRMRGELDPAEAASLYEEELRTAFALAPGELPRFDFMLMGMGPDGHTASLFPGTPALDEQKRLVASQFVPAVQSHRITLTFPVLNNARCCLFLVAGASKRPVLTQALRLLDEPTLPAQRVRPTAGELIWIVDEAAV